MRHSFTIHGSLPGLNEYISAERVNYVLPTPLLEDLLPAHAGVIRIYHGDMPGLLAAPRTRGGDPGTRNLLPRDAEGGIAAC